MSCEVHLKIFLPFSLDENEVVGVVGNTNELGNWNILKSLKMISKKTNNGEWEAVFPASVGVHIHYRYFIGVVIKSSKSSVLVKSWETHLHARTCVPSRTACIVNDGNYGVITGSEKKMVDKGWLTEQHELRLSVSSPKNSPFIEFIQDETNHALRTNGTNLDSYQIRLDASSTALASYTTRITPYSFVELSAMQKFNIPTTNDVHFVFTMQSLVPAKEFVRFYIYSENGDEFGFGVLSLGCLPTSKGIMKVPILNKKHAVVAVIRVPYLHIKPFSSSLSMEKCFTQHWKSRPMVNVGHRGSGNSFTSEKLADVWENTVSSLTKASNHGAQFVEFDVHLTKDVVPIVYHDLTACVSSAGKFSDDKLIEVPVNTLTLSELRSLKMRHKSRRHSSKKLDIDESDENIASQPFPTLEEALNEVPLVTGFNIEVKWPCLDEDNDFEDNLEHYFDANQFVDAILKVVLESARSRKIIFSCFDVDICIMLRRKQNRYPVLFLTNGDTLHYKPMLDLREASNQMAIGTAMAEGFLGLDTLEKDVYKTPDIVRKTHDAGLLFACYGDDVGDNLKTLEKASVDIAIYDRIYTNQQLTENNST